MDPKDFLRTTSNYSRENSITFKQPKAYDIDFNKVNSIEDLLVILKAINITFYDNSNTFEEVKKYLKEK